MVTDGRSTVSFLLAAKLQRVDDAAELRKAAQAVSFLAARAAAHHLQNYGGGRQRTRGGGDSLSSAGPHRCRIGDSQRFPERGCLLSPGDMVGHMAARW